MYGMEFEVYVKNVWEKEHPFCSIFDDEDFVADLDKSCLQRLDWYDYCINRQMQNKIAQKDIESLFNDLIEYFKVCAVNEFESKIFDFPAGLTFRLFEICKNHFSYTKVDLEKMDSKLLDEMVNKFNSLFEDVANQNFSFEKLLIKCIAWLNFRRVFLTQLKLGFSMDECTIPCNIQRCFRKELSDLRFVDYLVFIECANHAIWLYENSKHVPRIDTIGEMKKINDFAVLCCRDALAAARFNGYFEKEEIIRNKIQSIKADVVSEPSVFISYNWGKKTLVDNIQNEIGQYCIVRRDCKDMEFGDSITSFMNTIRQEDFALIILSDAYLKSDACMYELTTLFKDVGSESFNHRVFFVVCDDARPIFKPLGRSTYMKFWENRYYELKDSLSKLSPESGVELTREIRKVSFIRLQLDEFLDYVSSVNNSNESDVVENLGKYLRTNISGGKIGRNLIEDYFIAMNSINTQDSSI